MTTTVEQVTPDRIMLMTHGFWPAQILSSAAACDFFTHIAHGRQTAEAVANAAGTDPRATRMVLDSLVALEFLRKDAGCYSLAPDAEAFLVRDRPQSVIEMVAEHPPLMWEHWGKLRDSLKSGQPVKRVHETAGGGEFFPKLIRMIMSLSLGPAQVTAEHLGIGTTLKGAAVLDVGAGGCAWSIPFAKRDPAARITAFDLPPVLDESSKIVREFGVSRSFSMQPGDYRKDELGHEYDIIIFGNICHIETSDGNRALIGRAFRALKDGGRLVIGDMVPNEERSGPPFPVMFALNMLLHGEGDTYTFSEYQRWLEEEGFRQAEAFDTRRSHSPVIIATK